MDLMNPAVSPIHRVLQYYGCCIRGHAPRLRLLWGSSECASFKEWARVPENGEALAMLRGALTTAYTWTHARFMEHSSHWPWRAAMLADQRIDMSERKTLAQELYDSPQEKLDVYFTQRLRACLASPQGVFAEDMRSAILHGLVCSMQHFGH